MPLKTPEFNLNRQKLEEFGLKHKDIQSFLPTMHMERLALELSAEQTVKPNIDIAHYGHVDYYFPETRYILDRIPATPPQIDWLKSVGLKKILLHLKPNEKLGDFNSRILNKLKQRQMELAQKEIQVKKILLEKFKISDNYSEEIRKQIGSSNFILAYLEAQNYVHRNDFSILELASGDYTSRGYDQSGELYVPLICEVLSRSGFAVAGIDKYQAIGAQNLDFSKVQGVDLTSDTWEKVIKHRYDMVVFMRDWHSEIFLSKYRSKSSRIIHETDFLVAEFVQEIMPKVHDILNHRGVFFCSSPFKKASLFVVEEEFAKYGLEVFYNLEGLILARRVEFDTEEFVNI